MNQYILPAAGVGGLLLLGWLSGRPAPAAPRPPPRLPLDEDVPPSPPPKVLGIFLDEIEAQSKPKAGAKMKKVLEKFMTAGTSSWAAVAVPCDQRIDGVPAADYWNRVAGVIAESHGVDYEVVPFSWSDEVRGGSVGMCAVVFFIKGTAIPMMDHALFVKAATPRYGGKSDTFGGKSSSFGGKSDTFGSGMRGTAGKIDIVGMVVGSVVNAVVGSVVGLGMGALIESLGGEARLRRKLNRYERTKNPQLKAKILRQYNRLRKKRKGWAMSEVEQTLL